jgi:glycosyltransferase involved in cell wall biosynthesis
MPRIFFVNRFFHPDFSATSQMLTDLAMHLAKEGRQVVVLTSRLSYDDPSVTYAPREVVGGVKVIRVRTPRFGRATLAGRMLDYLGFYFSAFLALLRHVRRGDVIVAKTDPPLISILAAVAARLRGARLVNWLQDVFPETAAVLGIGLLAGPIGHLLMAMRNASLRMAAANVALGTAMARYVAGTGVAARRISIIPNWCDDKSIVPLDSGANPLSATWSWTGKFVAVYSGNLGRAHEVDTFLRAARELAADPGIAFAFIGAGARLAHARQFVATERLANVVFLPYQPREQLALSLGAANLHLVSLLPELENFIFPSKLYGVLAAGRPVAFVGDPDGEIGGLLRRADCGLAFSCGDAAGLAAYVKRLAANPAEASRLGRNARALLESELTQARSLAAWSALLNQIAGTGNLATYPSE